MLLRTLSSCFGGSSRYLLLSFSLLTDDQLIKLSGIFYFKLMFDLLAPRAVTQYAFRDSQLSSNGKINVKVPPAHQSHPKL
jgi:hypothetical protein